MGEPVDRRLPWAAVRTSTRRGDCHTVATHLDEGVRPVIKWPGGKQRLLPNILPLIPPVYGRYFEPFAGGAALFFCLKPASAVLGDINIDLVNFYWQLTINSDRIADRVKHLENNRHMYYKMRRWTPNDGLEKAVRFYYLNRTCFSGIYRTNSYGAFNVPFGNNERAVLPDPGNLHLAGRLLRKAIVLWEDFERTCSSAKEGDLVYFDPPYTLAHENNGFLRYNSSIFSWADQLRLRDLVGLLSKRGVNVILTNAMHSSIFNLYLGFRAIPVSRASSLNPDPSFRRPVTELIVMNY